jgi:uncharacterized YccA/Bax inhibitor family protein
MANPLLTDKTLDQAVERAGWAAPSTAQRGTQLRPQDYPQLNDTISPWDQPKARQAPMTVNGTVTATAFLLALLVVAGTAGWIATKANAAGAVQFPSIAFVGIFVGLGCVIGANLKPQWARILAPVYALAEGFFVGAISKAYNTYQNGIVVQAVGGTVAVFAVMLFLYRTRIIKVTERFRKIVIGATLGIALLYLVSMVFSLFGHTPSFIHDASPLGIGFSVLAIIIAASNLALNFDVIERAAARQLPKQMEWVCALGLLVTLVWLYLELLRLLSRLNRR